MLFHSYRVSEDGHAFAPIAWWAIVVTTQKQSGEVYEFAGLGLGLQSETQSTAVGWADGGG
jgi:hypothetical protein